MTQMKRMGLALLFTFGIGATGNAQTIHESSTARGHHGGGSMNKLSEPGQGAFAALTEVVRSLEDDAGTDWSKVDMTALRDHLVDMDLLVTDAVARQTELNDGLSIEVTGDVRSLAAAKRMIPTHSELLGREGHWMIDVTIDNERVVMRATSHNPAIVAKIKALGFYGLMASRDHHRMHHWALAIGGLVHVRQ